MQIELSAKEEEETRANNDVLISDFVKHLENKGLSKKTIQRHALNMSFYANSYLLARERTCVEEGHSHIEYFLGGYIIRNTTWGNKTEIIQYCGTFNKFYTYLNTKGLVKDIDLEEMKFLIKEAKSEWIAEAESSW